MERTGGVFEAVSERSCLADDEVDLTVSEQNFLVSSHSINTTKTDGSKIFVFDAQVSPYFGNEQQPSYSYIRISSASSRLQSHPFHL